jgi:hypothetical protein
MKHFHLSVPHFLVILLAAFLFGTGKAEARRGIMIISHGSTIDEIGKVSNRGGIDLPPTWSKIGFQYEHFGIFWLDLWNWSGEYVIYDGVKEGNGDHGEVVTKAQAAAFMGLDESKVGKPLNYRFPYGLDILLALGLLKFVPRYLAKKRQAGSVPQYNQENVPAWKPPASPPAGAPASPPAGGPPPIPPPLPPEEP